MKDFTSYDTKKIKGFAIILMLAHHLWAFPNRIAGGELKHLFTIFGDSSLLILGNFGKICISLFFFLGGYGIYIQSKKKGFNILKNIKKIYIAYWKVFIIFIPLALIFFNNWVPFCEAQDIYLRFAGWTWKDVVKNFLGVSSSLNGEWWFLSSYVVAIVLFPLLKGLIEKNSLLKNLFYIVIISILMTNVFPAIGSIKYLGTLNNNYLYNTIFCQTAPYITCFYIGVLFAKENLIIKLYNKINEVIKLNTITDIIILGVIIFFRSYVAGPEMDIIYVPLLIIILIDILSHIPILEKTFEKLGENSTNMWLIHSFYCYYFYPIVKIVVALRWGIPCLIVLIVLTLISSYIIDYFWELIKKIYNKCLTFTKKYIKRESY